MSVETMRVERRPETRLQVVMYADYLCPWCWPAAFGLWDLQLRYPQAIELEHRALILLPEEGPRAFTEYHLEQRRVARQKYGFPFHLPEVGSPYPSSSLPALEAAKWVQRERPDRFAEFDLAVYEAFYRETRDISDIETLVELADTLDLSTLSLREALYSREMLDQVWAEHHQAEDDQITLMPTVEIEAYRLAGPVSYQDYERAIAEVIGLREPAPYD